jgi:flagellar hook-length control protein FliK
VLQRGERDRYIARSEGLVDGVADGAGADASQAVAEGARADWRTALDVQVDRMAARNAPVPQEAGGGFKTLPALRSTERQSGRSVFVPVDGSLGSAGAASTYLASATTGTGATATADAPFAAGSSSEVAQKVHYWVTRGVQNAELQLDAFAGGAVDVSISMLGNEAQVEFRSDQPEARKMLQDAMPQLREMLRSEGLELSGGFVGTSAQRDSQARRDGPNTAAGRVATIVVPDQTTTRTLQSPAMQTRALDVFV